MKFIFFVVLAILTNFAMAKDHPCKEDAKKFCGTIKGKHEVYRCMISHINELSAICREKTEKNKEKQEGKFSEIKTSCNKEIKTFCSGKFDSRSEMVKCLRNNKNKISNLNCKNKLEK